jgi:hypothetical protein
MRNETRLAALLVLATEIAAAGPLPAQMPVQQELVFTSLSPCRLFDTRSGGPLQPGQATTWTLSGSCGLPLGGSGRVVAVVVNIAAAAPHGPGHLTAWPAGQPKPLSSVINYNPGVTIANGLVLQVCHGLGLACSSGELTIEAAVSPTHLVLDVVGYFGPALRPGAMRYGAGSGPESFLCVNGAQNVVFGLSHIAVEWIDAEHACPSGSWVCSESERGTGPCNTSRPDGTCDYVGDTGSCADMAADGHRGWTRPRNTSQGGVATVTGLAVDEYGGAVSARFGAHLPVWCCSPF